MRFWKQKQPEITVDPKAYRLAMRLKRRHESEDRIRQILIQNGVSWEQSLTVLEAVNRDYYQDSSNRWQRLQDRRQGILLLANGVFAILIGVGLMSVARAPYSYVIFVILLIVLWALLKNVRQ